MMSEPGSNDHGSILGDVDGVQFSRNSNICDIGERVNMIVNQGRGQFRGSCFQLTATTVDPARCSQANIFA
jgi:hypothetical protein